MEALIERIERPPLSFAQFRGDASRRAFGKRFPFMIVFDVEDDLITVMAVVHQHADPATYRRA